MAIYLKDDKVNAIYKGGTEIISMYRGNNLIYSKSDMVDKTPKVTNYINNATNVIDSSTTWINANEKSMELHIYNTTSYPTNYVTFTLTGEYLDSAYMLATNTDNVEAMVYGVNSTGITIGIKITSEFITAKSTSFTVKIISSSAKEIDFVIDVVLNAAAVDYTPYITGFINTATSVVGANSWLVDSSLLELHILPTATASNVYYEIVLVGKNVDNAYMLATNTDNVEATLNGFNASGLRVAFKITEAFINTKNTTFTIKLISNHGKESDFNVNVVMDV